MRDEALLTLGFVASDDPKTLDVLIPELKNSPNPILRALIQFGPLEQSAQNSILEFIEANPGRLKREDESLAVAVLAQCKLDVTMLERMKQLRADKTRSSTLRIELLNILESFEK